MKNNKERQPFRTPLIINYSATQLPTSTESEEKIEKCTPSINPNHLSFQIGFFRNLPSDALNHISSFLTDGTDQKDDKNETKENDFLNLKQISRDFYGDIAIEDHEYRYQWAKIGGLPIKFCYEQHKKCCEEDRQRNVAPPSYGDRGSDNCFWMVLCLPLSTTIFGFGLVTTFSGFILGALKDLNGNCCGYNIRPYSGNRIKVLSPAKARMLFFGQNDTHKRKDNAKISVELSSNVEPMVL